MRSYAQYCPIAKASEILGDRWTLLIVREMLGGAKGFNELRRGLPGISRSVLTDRLRSLERAEIVARRTGPKGRTLEYQLTPAGRDLEPVVQAMGEWGVTWSFTEPRPDELDPDLLIVWMARHVHREQLPPRPNRPSVRLSRSGQALLDGARALGGLGVPAASRVRHRPQGTVDTATLYRVYLGRTELGGAMRMRKLAMTGPRALQRGFGRWFAWSALPPPAARPSTAARRRRG